MDELKIMSKFTTNIISRIIRTLIKKKVGYDVDIRLNSINTKIVDGRTKVHLDIDAEMSTDELLKLLKGNGLC